MLHCAWTTGSRHYVSMFGKAWSIKSKRNDECRDLEQVVHNRSWSTALVTMSILVFSCICILGI